MTPDLVLGALLAAATPSQPATPVIVAAEVVPAPAQTWWTRTFGFNWVAPSPNLGVGGEVGVHLFDRLVDAGLDGQVFWFPRQTDAGGIAIGAHLRLAPVPGDWGRRFYLHGRANRTVGVGSPVFNGFGLGGGLGYRQPFFADGAHGPRQWYVEIGLARTYLFQYAEAVYYPDAVRLGFTW